MIRLTYLGTIVVASLAVHILTGCAGHRTSETASSQPTGFVWGDPHGGVRIGIHVAKVRCGNLDLFTFIIAAENLTKNPLKIAFGDYGTGPQHPVYVVVDTKGEEQGCIIPPRVYARRDPYNPQPSFPMKLLPGEVTVLYTASFVPPLGPGNYRIYARVSPHIPAAPAFENEARRKTVADETWASLTGRLESGPVTLTIPNRGQQEPQPAHAVERVQPAASRPSVPAN